jgi:predicted small secreted protein
LTQQGEGTKLTWLPTSAVVKEFNSGNLTEEHAIKILDEQFKTIDGVDGSFLINTRNYNEVIDALDEKIPDAEQARILKALFPRD